MKSKPNQKHISRKRLLNILSFFDERRIARFVARNIFKNNSYTRFYWLYLSMIVGSFIIMQISRPYHLNELRLWIVAIVGSLIAVLIPIHIIHEIIRSRLLKNIGDVKANYLWSWKNMILKVKYLKLEQTSKEDLVRVNMIPFLLFSIIPFVLSFLTAGYLQLFLLSLAFFHGIYCIKAFALLSFLKRKKK